MNKFLLLVLLGFVLIVLSDATEGNKQEIEEIEGIKIIEARAAKRYKNTNKGNISRKKTKRKAANKAKNKSGRKSTKHIDGNSEMREPTCLDISCIDTAVGYMKLLKDKVANFDKQNSRIMKQNKTGSSKAGKNDIFGSIISRIVENGGGNASNLTCNGKLNEGASQLTNLTETLLNCEEEIKNNCDPSNLPQPNMTEVTNCNIAIDAFKKKSGECFQTTGSAACTCWSDSALETAAKTIKSCDLSKDSKLFAKALKKCTSTFGKCRKYEDDVGTVIHACNLDSDILVKKLKNLQQNEAALQSHKSNLDSTITRDASARTVSCAEVASITSQVLSLVAQTPHSFSIFSLLQTLLGVTFTCTDAEKEALKAVTAQVNEAIEMVAAEATHIQASIILLTGSAASEEEIEAAEDCQTDQECQSVISLDSSSASGQEPVSMSSSGSSGQAPVSMTSSAQSESTHIAMASESTSFSMETESSPSTNPAEESTMTPIPQMLTTQRTRRLAYQMMRKRMVQTLI